MNIWVFLITSILGISQMNVQTVTLSILKNGRWEWTYPDTSKSRHFTFQFTDTQVNENVYYVRLEKSQGSTHRFYLANESTSQFNERMAGKTQSGKYIVYETMNNKAISFQILSATTTQIKMKHPGGDVIILTRQ